MKVMVALDGSENAYDALRRALALTKPEDSLLLVHTVEEMHFPAPFMDVSGVMDMMEARAKKIMQRAKTMCTAQGRRREGQVEEKIAFTKNTREALLHQIEKREVELVCMGSRGLGGVSKALLGSTSSYLLQHAPAGCSILVIRQDNGASA